MTDISDHLQNKVNRDLKKQGKSRQGFEGFKPKGSNTTSAAREITKKQHDILVGKIRPKQTSSL